jgi:hypothetical protein
VTAPAFTTPTPLSAAASTILAAAGAALDASGIGGFPNREVQPGREVVVDEPGLLAVVLKQYHPGRIGIQQFAGQLPGQATWPQNVAVFSVELWADVPISSIGAISGVRPPSARRLTMSALDLLDAGFVVSAALQAEQYANELFPTHPMLIGPVDPIGTQGALAGMAIGVQLQFP